MEIVPRDDPRVVALSAALEPYAWTKATPEMLARRAVGAVEPADPGDERVGVLVAVLRTLRWRTLTRTALCRQLVSALESWSVSRQFADIELGWLLDGGG